MPRSYTTTPDATADRTVLEPNLEALFSSNKIIVIVHFVSAQSSNRATSSERPVSLKG